MKRNDVKKAGKLFGEICKIVGVIFCLIGCALTPREDIVIDKTGVIIVALSLVLYKYGCWRTGSYIVNIDLEELK